MKPNLIKVLKQIRKINIDQDSYLDSVPRDLRSLVFDNKFAALEGSKNDILMESLFGDLYEDVCWFLYEFNAQKTSNTPHIVADGKEYLFKSDEDFYKYLENQEQS